MRTIQVSMQMSGGSEIEEIHVICAHGWRIVEKILLIGLWISFRKGIKMKVMFVQPFTVNAALAQKTIGRVVVLDVGFNQGSIQAKGTPEEQFIATTGAFIDALGDDLAMWVDHHPHKAWEKYVNDNRFMLVPREQALACPLLITPEMVSRVGEVDTIVCHGDFDGIMSAIKWMLGGVEPYTGADNDSVAMDARIGVPSPLAIRYDRAMKANLGDDAVRYAIVIDMTYSIHEDVDEMSQAGWIISAAASRYMAVQQETERLSKEYEVVRRVAVVDASLASQFDLTGLLLMGQKVAEVAIVRSVQRGEAQWTVAAPIKSGWNFLETLSGSTGMPTRVNLPDQAVSEIIAKING